MIRTLFIFPLLLFIWPQAGHTQTLPIGDPMEHYLRLMEDDLGGDYQPSFNLRPVELPANFPDETRGVIHPWQNQVYFNPLTPNESVTAQSPVNGEVEANVDPGRVAEPDIQNRPILLTVERPDTLLHSVVAGETLFSISRLYGVTVEELMEWNDLEETLLSIGQILYVVQTAGEDPLESETENPSESPDSTDNDPPSVGNSEYDGIGQESSESNKNTLQGYLNHDIFQNLSFYSPVLTSSYNNNLPFGQNDGPLWQGRGMSTSLSLGVHVNYGLLKASIRPVFLNSQNMDFELSNWLPPEGISEYGYAFSMIDYPQRFGDRPVSRLDPGQSWIRMDVNDYTVGLSTANIWAGPAIHNPIIFSNNAPGFFHAFIGTHRPVQSKIGNFEGKLLWGRLKESNFFDDDDSNDLRLINALILNYSPSFLPGLHLGFVRSFVKPVSVDGPMFADFFMAFGRKNGTVDEDGSVGSDRLQMTSLFGRWQIPGYGFEFYGEWSRNTPSNGFRDILLEPEYSRGYVLGFLKRFVLNHGRWLTLNYEMTHLESPRLSEFRVSESYYLSEAVPQGYTHHGQMIGAGIGPGSNSQRVGLEYFDHWGMAGLSFNRVVHDIERLYENYEIIGEREFFTFNPRELNEVELRYGLRGLVFLPYNLEVQADLFRSKFFHFRHRSFGEVDVYNTNLQLTLRYNLPGGLR